MELRERLIEAIIKACPNSIVRPSKWEAEHYADAILAIPEIDPTPLHQRVLAMLGGLRDEMTPEDVSAVQRFVDRFRPDPPLEQHGEK